MDNAWQVSSSVHKFTQSHHFTASVCQYIQSGGRANPMENGLNTMNSGSAINHEIPPNDFITSSILLIQQNHPIRFCKRNSCFSMDPSVGAFCHFSWSQCVDFLGWVWLVITNQMARQRSSCQSKFLIMFVKFKVGWCYLAVHNSSIGHLVRPLVWPN